MFCFINDFCFLVERSRLYKTLCRSVGPSVSFYFNLIQSNAGCNLNFSTEIWTNKNPLWIGFHNSASKMKVNYNLIYISATVTHNLCLILIHISSPILQLHNSDQQLCQATPPAFLTSNFSLQL